MIFIQSLIKKFKPKDLSIPLGRWKLENSNVKINKKIDWSNEDHCGPCGKNIIKPIDNPGEFQ